MSPSARLAQETTFARNDISDVWACECCQAEFEYADLNDPADITPPKFCPNCGRRAAQPLRSGALDGRHKENT